MNIAVLGIGNIGGTLGKKWAKAGHQVMGGVRDVNAPKVQAFLTSDNNLTIGTVEQAIALGEVILFALPGTAVEAVVEAHAAALNEKIIIDATNNIRAEEVNSIRIFTTRTPQAKIFRAFNSLGWENFAEPQFGNLQADMFYCGSEDGQARQVVEQLIADIGLKPVCIGDLEQVAILDGVLRLWFALAMGQKMGRHLAFKVLTPSG